MKNKILSIVLAFIFVFACYPTVNAKTDNLYFDEANTLLVGLGFEDVSSKANEIISREALIELLVDNSFYEGIELGDLAMMGIYADANFYFLPENQICLKDALIICVKLLTLGDTTITDHDRLTIAWDLDLKKGIFTELNAPLTYADAYILLYNYLNADISVYNGRFAIGNTTILSDKHHIDIVEGFVDKAGRYAIDNEPLIKGKVSINGKVYVSEKYGEEIFGKNVVAYIRDSKTLIAANISTDTDVKEIYSYNSPTFTNNRYVYFDDVLKEKTIKISQSADMFYNGYEFNFDSNLICPESGKITVIDNSLYSDGADIVIIDSAETVKAEYVDRNSQIIYSAGKSFKLDDDTIITDDNGKTRAISKINAGDILSLYIGQNNIASKCVKITKTVSGTLDSTGDDFITINGKKYSVTESLNLKSKENLGKTISAYIDKYGTLVHLTTENTVSLNVGISRVVKLFEKGLSSSLRIKIYTEAGIDEEFYFAENARVNGTLCKTYAETERAIPKVGSNVKQSLVAYELNGKNEITAIDFPSDKIMDIDSPSRIYKTAKDNLSAFSHVTYNKWREDFGESVFITPETKVFRVPRQQADGTICEDTVFYSATVCSSMVTGTAYHNHTSTGYGFDKESKISDVVLLEYDASTGSSAIMPELTPLSIVGSVSHILTPDGDEAEAVMLYDYINPDGRLIYGDSLSYFSSQNIEPGDLVRIDYTDETGKANMTELVYKNGAETLEDGGYLYTGSGGGKGQEADIRLCNVYKRWDIVLDLVYTNVDMENIQSEDIKSVKGSGYTIYKYNKQKGKIEVLTLDDILTYDISGENCSKVVMFDVSFSPASLFVLE
ncbi:MAG: hypothetical protein IJB70_11800 [Clostridia bacterium]|nr:hypothetical protein [Clostridia bacterium]